MGRRRWAEAPADRVVPLSDARWQVLQVPDPGEADWDGKLLWCEEKEAMVYRSS